MREHSKNGAVHRCFRLNKLNNKVRISWIENIKVNIDNVRSKTGKMISNDCAKV